LFTQRPNSGRKRQQQQHGLSEQQQIINGERKARQMQAERSPSRKTIRVCSNEATKSTGEEDGGRQASKQARAHQTLIPDPQKMLRSRIHHLWMKQWKGPEQTP